MKQQCPDEVTQPLLTDYYMCKDGVEGEDSAFRRNKQGIEQKRHAYAFEETEKQLTATWKDWLHFPIFRNIQDQFQESSIPFSLKEKLFLCAEKSSKTLEMDQQIPTCDSVPYSHYTQDAVDAETPQWRGLGTNLTEFEGQKSAQDTRGCKDRASVPGGLAYLFKAKHRLIAIVPLRKGLGFLLVCLKEATHAQCGGYSHNSCSELGL